MLIQGDLPVKLSAWVLYVYDKKSRDYKEVNHVQQDVFTSMRGEEERQTLSAFPAMTRQWCASVRVF
ncbi:hypothetical protein CIP106467_4345 [Citrobacter europaeus]|nr:hypothetical protein CIP106467_4345 [Citrobacter europaeus]